MNDFERMEMEEMRADDRIERRYQRQLANHPHCQDPDHPGCEKCEPEDDD